MCAIGPDQDSSHNLPTESEVLFQLEDCMLSFWSLCSRSLIYSSSVEESVRLKEDHMKDINSTVFRLPIFVLDSKIVAETDVVAESVEVSKFQVYGALQWSFEGRGPWDSHSVARNGIQEVHLRDQTCER